jgi:hypothetical protein
MEYIKVYWNLSNYIINRIHIMDNPVHHNLRNQIPRKLGAIRSHNQSPSLNGDIQSILSQTAAPVLIVKRNNFERAVAGAQRLELIQMKQG